MFPIACIPHGQFPGLAYDAVAAAYFAALGTTLSDEVKTATNTFIAGLRSSGRLTSGFQLLPFLTTSATDNAINALTPGTNNGTFNGSGFTHNATNGVTSDGTSGTYLNLGFNRPALGGTNHYTLLYIRTRTGANEDYVRTDNFGGAGNSFFVISNGAANLISFNSSNGLTSAAMTDSAAGTLIGNRSTTQSQILTPGNSSYSSTTNTADATLANHFVPLFGGSRLGSMITYADCALGLWMCGTESLAIGDATALRTLVINYMTSLGRNV